MSKKENSQTINNNPLWRKIAVVASKQNVSVYIVGGAVRDYWTQSETGDHDFLVIGDAAEFAADARAKLSGGKVVTFPKFGTSFFVLNQSKLEFTESKIPLNGLAEAEIVKGDLQKRDFTFNAAAAKLSAEDELTVYDPFDGFGDLHRKILRTPMEPEVTFGDDPLRLLRVFRFGAQFNVQFAEGMLEAVCQTAARLESVSRERIGEELMKILELPKPSEALGPMYLTGVMESILPEVANLAGVEKHGKFNHKDILKHTFKVVDNAAKAGADTMTRFAALLHDVAKPMTKRFDPVEGFTFHGHEDLGSRIAGRIGKRLRLTRENVKLVQKLTRLHMRPVNLVSAEVTDSAIRRLMTQAGEDMERQLILCRADITSGNPKKVKRYLANFDRMTERMQEVEAKDKERAFQSPVRGEEIMELCGLQPGPLVGKIKKAIEEAILDGIIENEYDQAREYLLANKDKWLEPE